MSEAKKSKILTAARSVFLRYGYRRVNMNDLAEAAGVSRPALYVLFKNKEQIFIGVFLQWIDETITDVMAAMAIAAQPEEKIERAFEIWALRPFEMAMASPEAQELIECTLGFAQTAQRQGYAKFEATIAPVLASFSDVLPIQDRIEPERLAHILASAIRGFKLTARTPDELSSLIRDLLILTFERGGL
jgi:AcrR family transcriptional regulator